MIEIRKNKRKILDIKTCSSMLKMITCLAIFCILFLFNTDSVFAVGGGDIHKEAVEKVAAISLQIASKGGSKILYADSSALGYYHYGETELLAKYRSYYEKVNGTIKNQDDFINYCIAKGNEKEKHSC